MKSIKLKYNKKTSYKGLYKQQGIFLLILLLILIGCKKEEPILFIEDYLILVDDDHVQKNEVMVFVYQIVEEFEKVGGAEVWEFEDFSGGKSAIEVAKEAVFENIVRIKVLKAKSSEFNIELSEEQKSQVKSQAQVYFDSMLESFKTTNKITYELVETLFLESAIATEVALEVTEDYIPEETIILEQLLLNDDYSKIYGLDTVDILTRITARHILFPVRELDQSGEYVMLTDEEKSLQYILAEEVHDMAIDGVDFKSLVTEYNGTEENEYVFSKALIPDEFKEELSTLAEGEVSEIVENEDGYYLFKVEGIELPLEEDIIKFEASVTDFENELRESIISALREDAFNSLYDEWKQDIVVRLDKTVWDNIELQIDGMGN